MKLLDSNIIIYSALPKYSFLREIFNEEKVYVSEIALLEVLGFSKITSEQEKYFSAVFSLINKIPITTEVITEAIKIRRSNNLTVGDSIIASSAKIYDLVLMTNNVSDFKGLKFLKIENPLKTK